MPEQSWTTCMLAFPSVRCLSGWFELFKPWHEGLRIRGASFAGAGRAHRLAEEGPELHGWRQGAAAPFRPLGAEQLRLLGLRE